MSSIQPLLMTASDTGGAGTATRRIHQGLKKIGVDSQMLVRDKSTDDSATYGPSSKFSKAISKVRPIIDSYPLKFYEPTSEYSLGWIPDRINKRVKTIDPDVVHLNWVAQGYMSMSSIDDFDKPIVWRLPDMWPFTGGCHYSEGCTRYQSACGNCPQLKSNHSLDPSRVTLVQKKRAVEQADVTVVATTSWLAEQADNSAILGNCPIEIIPNGLDTEVFKPFSSEVGRTLFKLPMNTPLILFGSVSPLSNSRKGYDLLVKSLNTLATKYDTDAEVIVFGTSEPTDPPDFGFPSHYTGYLHDEESLALLYSAADVMIVPSRYEGFGQTVTEALACGTPVVAFNTTGPQEIIDHKRTGYLASKYDPEDLASGIKWVLTDENRQSRLESQARNCAVDKYDLIDISNQYLDLYDEII